METLSQTFAERKPPLYKRMFKSLGFWVIVGIVAGIVLGYVNKEMAIASKPGVDYFIRRFKSSYWSYYFCYPSFRYH